jgi:hypothetical protein
MSTLHARLSTRQHRLSRREPPRHPWDDSPCDFGVTHCHASALAYLRHLCQLDHAARRASEIAALNASMIRTKQETASPGRAAVSTDPHPVRRSEDGCYSDGA